MPTVRKQQAKKAKRPAKKKTKRSRKQGAKKGVLERIGPVQLKRVGYKVSVYGRSGTGKTTFACTFPKPLLLIGVEDGTKSVHNVKGVDFVPIDNSGELTEVVEFLADSNYKTAVLDTASALQSLILKEILELDELPAQLDWGLARREEWGQCALQTKERLRSLIELVEKCGMHIVINSQEREFSMDNEESIILPYVSAALTPSVTGWLDPECDYIVQTFKRPKTRVKEVKVGKKRVKKEIKTGEIEYCLRTGPHEVYTTKFRLPRGIELPQAIADPAFKSMEQLIKQGG